MNLSLSSLLDGSLEITFTVPLNIYFRTFSICFLSLYLEYSGYDGWTTCRWSSVQNCWLEGASCYRYIKMILGIVYCIGSGFNKSTSFWFVTLDLHKYVDDNKWRLHAKFSLLSQFVRPSAVCKKNNREKN